MERHLTQNEYREHWESALDRMEDINRVISANLDDLERQYDVFDAIYNGLVNDIEILSSIYAGYNTVEGGEYILRLHSLLRSYRSRYTGEGIDFRLISALMDRIARLRDKSFSQFPAMDHSFAPESTLKEENEKIPAPDIRNKPHRWISFRRNSLWFITPCGTPRIIEQGGFRVDRGDNRGFFIMEGDRSLYALDLLPRPGKAQTPPVLVLEADDGRFYVADSIGSRIYAARDIVSPLVHPFRHYNAEFPGRVRMMGISHIMVPASA